MGSLFITRRQRGIHRVRNSAIAGNAFIVYNDSKGGSAMAQLTVRNVPEKIARALRVRAAQHGRSAEAEHRLLLEEALRTERDDFWARADAVRNRTPRQRSDSGALQREMRKAR